MKTIRLILVTGEWVVGTVGEETFDQITDAAALNMQVFRPRPLAWINVVVSGPTFEVGPDMKREHVRVIQMAHVVSIELVAEG